MLLHDCTNSKEIPDLKKKEFQIAINQIYSSILCGQKAHFVVVVLLLTFCHNVVVVNV